MTRVFKIKHQQIGDNRFVDIEGAFRMETISWNGYGFMEFLQHCNHFVQMHEWFVFCHMLADKFIGQLARNR